MADKKMDLIVQVIRICQTAMMSLPGGEVKEPPSEDSLYFDVITLLDLVILPSLSYLDSNCGVAEEIWNLLKHFPYNNRYYCFRPVLCWIQIGVD